MKVDLHCHTHLSDGKHLAAFLIERALENEVTHAELLDMMHVLGKELEVEGTNEVEPPTEPIEIPWSDGGEFRQRLRQLMDGHQ